MVRGFAPRCTACREFIPKFPIDKLMNINKYNLRLLKFQRFFFFFAFKVEKIKIREKIGIPFAVGIIQLIGINGDCNEPIITSNIIEVIKLLLFAVESR